MECCGLNILKPELRIGSHVSIKNTLLETIKEYGECKCLQIFLGSPTTYSCRTISKKDKDETSEYCKIHNKTFYVHCPYIANLAKPSCESSIQIITKELETVRGLPCSCVLHIGKVGTIENVCTHINQIENSGHLSSSTSPSFPLLLEIAAGQGTELGISWEEIRHLYEGLDKTKIGLCIDTQHAFASGLCSFSSHEDVVQLFESADSIMTKGISLIHLNDSEKPFGSRVDRHAPLRSGYIWYSSDKTLKSLVRLAKDYGIDMISETSNPLADNLLVRQYLQ